MKVIVDAFPNIKIADGSIEGLKWLAMVAMTFDHMNRIFFSTGNDLFYSIGRIAMPVFAFVFVYNIARSAEFVPAHYYKSFKRLVFFGLLATPAYIAMMRLEGLFPLNIMFTFLVAAATIFFYEKYGLGPRAILCFLVGGLFVEYGWFGVAICLSCWFFCKTPHPISLFVTLVTFIFLDVFNRSDWTLLSIPIIFLASQIDFKVPRCTYFFWGYYPLHLSVMVLVQHVYVIG